ncbi:MAG: HNH endonuclease [Proteobacteria bacterium]|nr:HNH endonuclease [Pseudomonadota bacterium]
MTDKNLTRREFLEKTVGRFWSKVDRSEVDGCWLWQGTLASPNDCGQRYGTFEFSESGKRVYFRAHRFAWMVCNGRIPDGKVIMHICDVSLCVNPAHLRAATHAENIADRDMKGRTARGEQQGASKLTESQAQFIKRSSKPTQLLANRFGIHYTTVMKIKQGLTWAHIE